MRLAQTISTVLAAATLLAASCTCGPGDACVEGDGDGDGDGTPTDTPLGDVPEDLPDNACAPDEAAFGDVCFEFVHLGIEATSTLTTAERAGGGFIYALTNDDNLHAIEFDGDGVVQSTAVKSVDGSRLVLGDFDGDGDNEIAVISSNTGLVMHEADGVQVSEATISVDAQGAYAGARPVGLPGGKVLIVGSASDGDAWKFVAHELIDDEWVQGDQLQTNACWAQPQGGSADFNGDGRTDAAVFVHTDTCLDAGESNTVTVAWADDGAELHTTVLPVEGEVSVEVGDLDGGPGPDLITTSLGSYMFHAGNGDGTFAASVERSLPSAHPNMRIRVLGDFDGDAIGEALVDDSGLFILSDMLGESQLHVFELAVELSLPYHAADLNADGIDDLIASTADGPDLSLVVLLSRKAG